MRVPQATLLGRVQPLRTVLLDRRGSSTVRSLHSYPLSTSALELTPLHHRSSFLETLCDHLYDYLRPRILHEPSLTVLCQVCTVLQALMVLDADEDSSSETSNSAPSSPLLSPTTHHELPSPSSQVSPRTYFQRSILVEEKNRKKKLEIKGLLAPVLQDAQTRLVFRAQAVLQNGVGRFSAGEGDLDYPEKLEKGESDYLGASSTRILSRGRICFSPTLISLSPFFPSCNSRRQCQGTSSSQGRRRSESSSWIDRGSRQRLGDHFGRRGETRGGGRR